MTDKPGVWSEDTIRKIADAILTGLRPRPPPPAPQTVTLTWYALDLIKRALAHATTHDGTLRPVPSPDLISQYEALLAVLSRADALTLTTASQFNASAIACVLADNKGIAIP